MNCVAITLSLAAAFAAGCSVTHLLRPAIAAENITAQVIQHRRARRRRSSACPQAPACAPRLFVAADGMTISIQDGNVGKHMHPNTNEIQYILDGTGTVWLGDKEVRVKPGDLVVIPKGTAHGGTKPDGRTHQGDRDQDAAAGAGRYEDVELTRRTSRAVGWAKAHAVPTSACITIGETGRFVAHPTISAMTATYPRPSAAVGRQTKSLRSTSVTPKSIRMTKADSTNMPANTAATSNTPSACWIR